MAGSRFWRLEWTTAAGILWIAAVRLVGLFSYPRIEADEGGWPLAVRQWVDDGLRTPDYYMAPGYHWLLGLPFWLFGAQHSVARPVSAVWGLIGLWLFYRLTKRLAGERTAWWAVLLLGTSYSAALVDRRAFMEPFQVTLMLALCVVVVEANRGWTWLAAGLTALLLLTKSSAIFLLPALVLAHLAPGPLSQSWRRSVNLALILGAGVLLAVGVFGWLYVADPHGFVAGWSADMQKANLPGSAKMGGRFALNPASAERTLRHFGTFEPILLGLAVAGFLRAVVSGRQALMLLWLTLGGSFLAVQLYVQSNHRAVIIPPLIFFGAWMLTECERDAERRSWFGGCLVVSWPGLSLFAIMTYSSVRLLSAGMSLPDLETGGAHWLRGRTLPGEVLVAAPYVAMQLDQPRPVSFFQLPSPFLPTPAALARLHATWVIVDDREWMFHVQEENGTPARMDEALAECCELKHTAPGSRVYRVRGLAAQR